MQNQNKKQDVNFGVGVSDRAITKLQSLMTKEGLECSFNSGDCLEVLLKLEHDTIGSIDFVPKGGLLLKWTGGELASTVEMPLNGKGKDNIVATFFKNLFATAAKPEEMKQYLTKVAAQYFPVEIAEMRLKFPVCRDTRESLFNERVLARLQALKQGKTPLTTALLNKWREGAANGAYGNSNHLV